MRPTLPSGAYDRPRSRRLVRPSAVVATLAVLAVSVFAGASAAQAAITTPFTSVFSQNVTGDIMLRGNVLMTCTTSTACTNNRNTAGGGSTANDALNNNDYNMVYVDSDSDSGTFNSSSSTVNMPAGATVLFAALTWSGRSTNANTNKAKLKVPGATSYTAVTAGQIATGASNAYQSYLDVTSQVQAAGNGSYTVADVQGTTGTDQYASWGLTVAYKDADAPARNLSIFRGFGTVQGSDVADIAISGFSTPPSGAVKTVLGTIAYEGDMGLVGDSLKLGSTGPGATSISDALHASTNAFDSTISDLGVDSSTRTPKYKNNMGVDIATFNADGLIPNGATTGTIRLSTGGETYYPGMITFAHELYAPRIDITKTSTVIKQGNNTNAGLLEPGDQLEYTLTGINNGDDSATATVLTDVIPAGTTYVPGSMTWNGAAKTDAPGDDEAKYTSGTKTIAVNLGIGATASAGGSVAINATTQTVKFRVTIDPVTDTLAIANTATISYSGIVFTSSISGASTTATVTAVERRSDLSVVKSRDLATVQVGASTPVTYTLVATNNGPDDDTAVTLTDNLPSGATVGAITTTQGSCTTPAGQVVCNLGSMVNGGTATVTVKAVLDSAADPATNSATIDGTNSDPTPSNNTSSVNTAVNTAPNADDDSKTTSGGAVTFDPRTNDSDPNGDTLTVAAPTTTTPNRGSVVVNANNTITYTATAGQAGTDTFTYAISDGRGGTDTATVTITIPNTAPTANDDSTSTLPGEDVTLSVLTNDTDPNVGVVSQTLSVSSVTQPSGGKGTVTTNGTTVTFEPSSTFRKGTATFTYTVSDGATGSSTATVTVTVPNRAPVAIDDDDTTPSGTAIDVNVVLNDSDDNGDVLDLTGVVGAAHGTATITGTGGNKRVHYVPDAGWFGDDTMTYTISDGTTTATAVLTITTESAKPVASSFSKTVPGGESTTIDVLAHVTDSDTAAGDLDTIGTAGAANGTITVDSSGNVIYTPDAGFAGTDTFDYTVTDPQGNEDTATVTVTVSNQGPTATDDSANVPLNGSVDIDVLLNDDDPNNDALTVTVGTGPSNGTVTVLSDGKIKYVPANGFLGTDTFTYVIDDGEGGTDTATVTVDVANDPPVAVTDNRTHTGPVGSALTIDVIANDTDPNGDSLEVTEIVGGPNHGTVTIVDNKVVYTPSATWTGTDSFQYRISDGNGGITDGTVNVDVQNADPVANDNSATASSGIAKVIDVIANDTDADGETLTVLSNTTPAHGTVTVDPDGKLRYTPAAGYVGTDTFTYVVTDPRGGTDTATVTVTVGNAPPAAAPSTTSTAGGTATTIDLMPLVSDPDGQTVVITSVGNPAHGTAVLDPQTGKVLYTPVAGYFGTDQVCYTASDGNGETANACVTVTVANQPPVAKDDVSATKSGTPVTVNVIANDTDPNGGQNIAVTTANVTKGKGTVTITADGKLKVTPAKDFTGTLLVTYKISDGHGGTDEAVLRVEVSAKPVVNLDAEATITVGAAAITLDPADTVTDHGALVVVSTTQPASGVKVKVVDGKIVVTKTGDFVGDADFTYVVRGADGQLVTVHQTIKVLGAEGNNSAVPSALANTGTNSLPLGLTALLLIGIGGFFVLVTRRTRSE